MTRPATGALFDRLPEVSREIHRAPHFLLCLDFDGTLAPIVPNPADAYIPDDTRAVLNSLASRRDIILAVVSGRALRDLRHRVGLNAILAGNHGLEIAAAGIDFHHPQAAASQLALQKISSEIRLRASAIPGTLVENKGLTASVHYRNVAQENRPALSEIVRSVVAPWLGQFFVRTGKTIFEIIPRVAWHKGTAILWILERLRERGMEQVSVCYIGDDTTDEVAFRELNGAVTIRVGADSATAARFSVRDPDEVREFLRWVSNEKAGAAHTA